MRLVPLRLIAIATATALLVLPASAARAAPAAPTSLTVGGIACAPGGILIGTTTPTITAVLTGSGQPVTPTFALWPVGKPAERTEWSAPALAPPGTAFTRTPADLINGGRYRLTAGVIDTGGVRSAWSSACTFTVDTIQPHRPVVTSADYPENKNAGGIGITGTFTFAVAGGDRDVARFRYWWSSGGLTDIPVDRTGRATIEITPTRYGTNQITVQAIDRTGNRSGESLYSFSVIDHEPKVLPQNPEAGLGEPQTVRFWSAVPGTASFTYSLNAGPSETVAAIDGEATVTVTPDRRGANFLTVSSRTASGVESPTTTANLYIAVTVPRPVITSPDFPEDGTSPPTAGREVTIVLRSSSAEVTEFVWSGDFGETFQTVAADQDGTATVRYTTQDWYLYLEVQARARTADGFESDTITTQWELTPAAELPTS